MAWSDPQAHLVLWVKDSLAEVVIADERGAGEVAVPVPGQTAAAAAHPAARA